MAVRCKRTSAPDSPPCPSRQPGKRVAALLTRGHTTPAAVSAVSVSVACRCRKVWTSLRSGPERLARSGGARSRGRHFAVALGAFDRRHLCRYGAVHRQRRHLLHRQHHAHATRTRGELPRGRGAEASHGWPVRADVCEWFP